MKWGTYKLPTPGRSVGTTVTYGLRGIGWRIVHGTMETLESARSAKPNNRYEVVKITVEVIADR